MLLRLSPLMRRKTLLVVDDRADCLQLVCSLVETARLPVRIVTACNGLEAATLARETTPDLVLMDLDMPVLDGFEATRRIKADPLTEHVPVVAVSGCGLPAGRELAFASGCEGFLAKPLDITTFMAMIHEHLA